MCIIVIEKHAGIRYDIILSLHALLKNKYR